MRFMYQTIFPNDLAVYYQITNNNYIIINNLLIEHLQLGELMENSDQSLLTANVVTTELTNVYIT